MTDTTFACVSAEGIRLECLRLAQRADKDADWIVQRAGEFERFVIGPEKPPAPLPSIEEPQQAPQSTDKATARPRSKSS